MSSFERELSAAIDSAERNAFIELIRSRPELSLADLAKLSKGRFSGLAGSISIGELLGSARAANNRPASAKRGASSASSSSSSSGGAINTRTPEGREAYDRAVIKAVNEIGEPAAAPQIRAIAGGSELQVRKSLNRLIEAGKVTFSGKARGTRYMATR